MINLTLEQEIIISNVSRKHGVSFNKVREIFESDFRTMIQKAKEVTSDESTHHVFLIPEFGKFIVNSSKFKKYDRFKTENSITSEE